jgi:hypothetical protein
MLFEKPRLSKLMPATLTNSRSFAFSHELAIPQMARTIIPSLKNFMDGFLANLRQSGQMSAAGKRI